MNLIDYRTKIDEIDNQILRLFMERMDISLQIARYKMENDLPILDASREQEKLDNIGEKAGDVLRPYAQRLFNLLFELSRSHQESVFGADDI